MRAAAALVLATACRPATSREMPRPAAVSLERLRDGARAFSSYAGIGDPMRTVIRDSTAWREFWEQLNRPFVPRPALPPIDFGRKMVVVAALGTRPNAGYDVVIEGAHRDSAGIRISLRVAAPASGCPVATVMTQPVDLALLAVSDQPVRFDERDVVVSCGPR
ncbi:MAG: protease complex subunit PrcB family protein [Gemmatimonadaceae bacterium]